ncbi:hypothetical protein Tsubulata_003013 [Turnera subulata]|uniref:PGG domain-containing protein n=1 Tax=Turnera subulata TaxID=218843 RepID=A0A9Q0G192_9ROSI|nr:hypothetical protein Tsubulata_003013 [Turnera subulata]
MLIDQEHLHAIPKDPSEDFYKYYRFKLGRDSPSDARNTLLVVATLIVAVTFQAAVNPPGGVWQQDEKNNNGTVIHKAGKSVLGSTDHGAYAIFLFGNALAFSSASQAIFYLVIGCPFQTEVSIAILATNFSYGACMAAVTPSGARYEKTRVIGN